MKKTPSLPRLLSRCLLAACLAAVPLSISPALAQSSATREKIELMADALRAREAGQLQEAKEKFETLLRRDPNDTRVQRMLDSLNRDMERQMAPAAPAPAVRPTPLVAPSTPDDASMAPAKPSGTVYGQAANVESFEPAATAASVNAKEDDVDDSVLAELDEILASESENQKELIERAEQAMDDAEELLENDRAAEADALLAEVQAAIPLNAATAEVIDDLIEARGNIFLAQGYDALEANNMERANEVLTQFEAAFGSNEQSEAFAAAISEVTNDPLRQDPEVLSPGFIAEQEAIQSLLVTARAQMLYGDYDGAQHTLRRIEAKSPNNPAAKALQLEVIQHLEQTGYLDHEKTREEMLREVSRAWQRPQVFDVETTSDGRVATGGTIREQLSKIVIPKVEFNGAPLDSVIKTLSDLTVDYDNDPSDGTGVNMVLLDNSGAQTPVTITLREFSMDQILDFVTEAAGYVWDVQRGAVVVQKGEEGIFLETEFFPMGNNVIIRITGGSTSSGGGSAVADPFAADPFGGGGANSGGGTEDTEAKVRSFFQRAGVDFDNTDGASLAFDGARIIVTQTPRNLERIRNILRRYDETDQVEIEAKFLEVQQGNLDQLGFNWTVASENFGFNNAVPQAAGFRNDGAIGASGNRTLAGAFGGNASNVQTNIDTAVLGVPPSSNTIIAPAPALQNALDLATGVGNQVNAIGILGGAEVGLMIDALSRQSGSDLLSAPRLTVLSGYTAEIVVAQELLYPETYNDTEAEVSSNENGGAAIGITPGTPQDFIKRNVGVEMEVTPTVEDNNNINLDLKPQVTEFEGFIQYGGKAIATAAGVTVTTDSGFLQPIFATRSVRTNVTIFDGATVVIGGLVREEVRTVSDKVPVLGDIPLLGRMFRSEGETMQKRNLLIFVTANLISPGGSLANQDFRNTRANALFQNPIVVTPGGGASRQAREGGQ